ncbi:MAG TPA: hypothetical protein VNE58_02025 [Casimicrobiaceae bacterium]|nr:hypothetical protein [Casimicrobiaceae bacterium]
MRITIVLSGLLALPAEALATHRVLGRIAGTSRATIEPDLAQALLADVALGAAEAPLAALGAGLDVGARWVLRADPVRIVVGVQDARLEARVDDLDAGECAALKSLLDGHFAVDGLVFHAPRADAWFVMSDEPHAIDTSPLPRLIGAPLRGHLPTGRDGAKWRTWLTEAQMLLHDGPLARREPPVNALWFSGGGTLPDASVVARIAAFADDDRHGDLVRGVARIRGQQARSAASWGTALDASFEMVIVAPSTIATLQDLDALLDAFVAPALDALDRRRASVVKLIADGDGIAASWRVEHTSWLQQWLRPRARFTMPPADR